MEMFLLARRLRNRGYHAVVFWHCPWCGTLADKARDLVNMVDDIDSAVVHFVGHSMGGLIALRLFAEHVIEQPGRIVLMGAPINGSVAARRVLKIPLGRHLIGKCMATAYAESPLPLPPGREVGNIAGKINLCLGWLLGLGRPNDTVVALEETQRSDMSDACTLAVSHGGMLLSTTVTRCIESFLCTGTFAATDERQEKEHNQRLNASGGSHRNRVDS